MISLIGSFLLTVLCIGFLLPVLRRLKFGQRILEIGPSWHLSKSGTPTMGGIAFIICALVISFLLLLMREYESVTHAFLVLGYSVLGGIIGLVDDSLKLKRKQNAGLSAMSKLMLQIIAAIVFVFLMRKLGYIDTTVYIPFVKSSIDVGMAYYPLSILFLCGFSNAVNLTDGVDGLCASVSAVVSLFLALGGIYEINYGNSVFAVAVCGICLGFLVYNFHPAKIFMGDTGSLFLGSAIGGLALAGKANGLLLVYGSVYVFEAVSVILQVLYFKATKKRLFLMAPYHHHLEKKGFSEIKINVIFVAVTLVLCVIGHFFG